MLCTYAILKGTYIRRGYAMQRAEMQLFFTELKEKIEKTKHLQTSMKGRRFLNKLGYKVRSAKIVEEVERQLKKQNMYIVLPRGVHSWKELDLDDSFRFSLIDPTHRSKKDVPRIRKQAHIACLGEERQFPLYAYQHEAIQTIQRYAKKQPHFVGLLVLPTGAGKTTTAVEYALDELLVHNKKVLWLAHRHELLEQALRSFQKAAAFREGAPIAYKLISGKHEKASAISGEEQLLIASKDSVLNEQALKSFVQEAHCLIVIDEAHHAPARTYRQLLANVSKWTRSQQILGLTATPYRTSEDEAGAMKQLFKDGILFKRDLKTMIAAGIVSEPHFIQLQTDMSVDQVLTEEEKQAIELFDRLPEKIAKALSENRKRNDIIVQHFVKNRQKYGKTIVFAINQAHAHMLQHLFEKRHIQSGIVVSNTEKENHETIVAFRSNELDVLINVNILTEGADFPDVGTVFLTRPTTSSILMTQMIGRALRGEMAGGTKHAHIVSFIDDWVEQLNWANSEQLVEGPWMLNEAMTRDETSITELISQQTLTQIMHELDTQLQPTRQIRTTFTESVPVGVFVFSYLRKMANGEQTERAEILVYEHLEEAFARMKKEWPFILANYPAGSHESFRVIKEMAAKLEQLCFSHSYKAPTTTASELRDLIYYIVQMGEFPPYLPFENRQQVDLTALAETIVQDDLGPSRKNAYLKHYWQTHPLARVYFNYDELYFRKCIDLELLRMDYSMAALEDVSLTVWKVEQPLLYKRFVQTLFEQAKVAGGYRCMKTGRVYASKKQFNITYKKPLSKGGQTVLTNVLLVAKSDYNE